MNQREETSFVEVRSKRFDADTDRAKAAAWELENELRRAFGQDLPTIPSETGSKGDPITVAAIVLALITSGAVNKALDCVKAWIERDPADRELRVKGKVGERQVDLVIDATNMRDREISEILQSVAGSAPSTT
jgi:hypothetical protein